MKKGKKRDVPPQLFSSMLKLRQTKAVDDWFTTRVNPWSAWQAIATNSISLLVESSEIA